MHLDAALYVLQISICLASGVNKLNYEFRRFGNSTILSNYVRHVVASEKAWSRSSLEEESPDDLLYLSGFCRGGI